MKNGNLSTRASLFFTLAFLAGVCLSGLRPLQGYAAGAQDEISRLPKPPQSMPLAFDFELVSSFRAAEVVRVKNSKSAAECAKLSRQLSKDRADAEKDWATIQSESKNYEAMTSEIRRLTAKYPKDSRLTSQAEAWGRYFDSILMPRLNLELVQASSKLEEWSGSLKSCVTPTAEVTATPAPTPSMSVQSPSVSFVVQSGMRQRSRVNHWALTLGNSGLAFSGLTEADWLGAIQLQTLGVTGQGGRAETVDLQKSQFRYEPRTGSLLWSLDSFKFFRGTSLPDGVYELQIDFDRLVVGGQGLGKRVFRFHRLQGDLNADYAVNAIDLDLIGRSQKCSIFDGVGQFSAAEVAQRLKRERVQVVKYVLNALVQFDRRNLVKEVLAILSADSAFAEAYRLSEISPDQISRKELESFSVKIGGGGSAVCSLEGDLDDNLMVTSLDSVLVTSNSLGYPRKIDALPMARADSLVVQTTVLPVGLSSPTPTPTATPNATVSDSRGLIDLAANDDFGVRGQLAVRIISGPKHGQLVREDPKIPDRYRYTPRQNFVGDDSFSYGVQDSRGRESTARVSVRVVRYEPAKQMGRPKLVAPESSLTSETMGVVINTNDPESVTLGEYYVSKRNIPPENVMRISLEAFSEHGLKNYYTTYEALKRAFRPWEQRFPAKVQALALAWTRPALVHARYSDDDPKVGPCNSVSFAISARSYLRKNCDLTTGTPYFNSDSIRPFDDFGMRPSMHLAGETLSDALALVDRGVRADSTFPQGVGHFIVTRDVDRSFPRRRFFYQMPKLMGSDSGLKLYFRDNCHFYDGPNAPFPPVYGDSSRDQTCSRPWMSDYEADNKRNFAVGVRRLLFYQTGFFRLPWIETNDFLPGAVADHLTSYGGVFEQDRVPQPEGWQTNILKFLKAGATASSGTVYEPTNSASRFSNPLILVKRYFSGNTVIEALWKSIEYPSLTAFVGEPLARPWGSEVRVESGSLVVRFTSLRTDITQYELVGASSEAALNAGAIEVLARPVVFEGIEIKEARLPLTKHPVIRLQAIGQGK